MDPSTATFFSNSASHIFGFFGDRRATSRRNKETLKIYERQKAKYINDFRRRVVAWENDKSNSAIGVDSKWQETMTKIASDDLKLWQAMSTAGMATQQAYAAMMSTGASEQTGARSQTTTNRRQAVLKYAGRMNEIASQLSLAKDTAALNRTSWAQEFTRFAQKSHIKDIEGRPMPGHAPPPIPLENKPDFLSGLVLPLAGEYLGYKKMKSELDPPYSDEQLRGGIQKSPWATEAPTSNIPDFDWRNPPEMNLGSYSSGLGQLGDFFSKRSSNLASSRLGTGFLTTALNQF